VQNGELFSDPIASFRLVDYRAVRGTILALVGGGGGAMGCLICAACGVLSLWIGTIARVACCSTTRHTPGAVRMAIELVKRFRLITLPATL
jgi:hypothetical protein